MPETPFESSGPSSRRERVKAILMSVVALADAERGAFLERTCGDDLALLQEVLDLLRYERGAEAELGAEPTEAVGRSAPPPVAIGPYRVERVLGMGGMGTVYLGREPGAAGRLVALKVVRHAGLSTQGRHRFQREADALRRLEHPGIAHIYDSGVFEGEDGPRPYLALEYVEGRTLREVLDAGPADPAIALTLLAEVADALDYAHRMGVVHRDLKPENIMVDEAGRPRLLDFGVARLTDIENPSESLATRVGHMLGTVQYMSPEQAAASGKPVDGRSDIYSLGVIAYEWLGGALPYSASLESLHQAVVNILMAEPGALGERNAACRGNIESIVARALAKKPEHRYATAAEMAEDLRRHLRGQSIAPWQPVMGGSSPGVAAASGVARWPLAARVGLVLLGLVAVGLVARGVMNARGVSGRAGRGSAEESQRRMAALYSSLEDADRKLHRGSGTEMEYETALKILDAAHLELASLPTLSYAPRIEMFIQWRTGEGHYFLGSKRRDPAQFNAAATAWARAAEAGDRRAPLLGIDTTASIFPEIARLGMHHPYSGVGMAAEALAEFALPARNLSQAVMARRNALKCYESREWLNYDARYPPSPVDRQVDHALLLNDLGGCLARYGAVVDSVASIEQGLAVLARADTAWKFKQHRSPYGAFLQNMGSAFRMRGELTGRVADLDSAVVWLRSALAVRTPSESPGGYSKTKAEQAAVSLARARLTGDVRRKAALLEETLIHLTTARGVLNPASDTFAMAQLDLQDAETRAKLAGDLAGRAERVRCAGLLAEADSALARAGRKLTMQRYPRQHADLVRVQGLVADARWRRLGDANVRTRALAALGLALEQVPESADPHLHHQLQEVHDQLSGTARAKG